MSTVQPDGEAERRIPERVRRLAVIALSAVLVVAVCGVAGMGFASGSWWYFYMQDRPLDAETRARVEGLRDEVDASGKAPRAVMWLNAALDPSADSTAVRIHLVAAQETLESVGDPGFSRVSREIGVIAQDLRSGISNTTSTPFELPTLEWSG